MDHMSLHHLGIPSLVFLFLTITTQAQRTWEVLRTSDDIQIDGFLEEWETVPVLVISAGKPGVGSHGHFDSPDLTLTVRALWNSESLYLAVTWKDNEWDVHKVPRHEAVWVSPEKRRRDRMQFFDNLKFHIEEPFYSYILWISPRVGDQGPFLWYRLLEGPRGMETAVGAPLVTGRFRKDEATLEIMLNWEDLKKKPKLNQEIGLTLLVADSDLPGKMLETKANQLKWLQWDGQMKLTQERR
jgi:hypothetical protein